MTVDDAIDEPSGPVLDRADRQSPTWAKLRKHMEATQEALRLKNDSDLDLVATARVRGQIKALANLLALGNPDPAMTVADEERDE